MPTAEFESSTRSLGDYSGVYEYTDETTYFYLCRTTGQSLKILDHIHIFSGKMDVSDDELDLLWDHSETRVALFKRGQMWALYNVSSGAKFAGDYATGRPVVLPQTERFALSHKPVGE